METSIAFANRVLKPTVVALYSLEKLIEWKLYFGFGEIYNQLYSLLAREIN